MSNESSKSSSDLEIVPQTHIKFSPTNDTDITIQSSDSFLFYLHRKNLETHTGAFPSAEFIVNPEEVTHLTEPSVVLEVIFDFIYPRRQPSLENMEFDIVGPVAEAVEKYEVFSAMKVCEFRLRQFIPVHAAEILVHGIKHDYPSLIDEAAPYLARKPLLTGFQQLPPRALLSWCQYHEAWSQVFKSSIKKMVAMNSPTINKSSTWAIISSVEYILQWEESENISILQQYLAGTTEWICDNCSSSQLPPGTSPNQYVTDAAKFCWEGIKYIPPFTEFLR